MKIKLLLAASLFLAVGMTGCSNSLDDDKTGAGNDDNVLIVRLPNTIKSTRAIEDQVSDGAVSGVTDLTVFLLMGQTVERAVALTPEEIGAGSKRFDKVPSQVNRVIVVANKVGEDAIPTLTDASAIRNYAFSVVSQHKGTGVNNRTLMGEALVEEPVEPVGENKYKVAKVDLEAITARIEIGALKAGEGIQEIKLVAVYVNNFFEKYNSTSVKLYGESESFWDVDVTPAGLKPNQGTIEDITIVKTQDYNPTEYKILGDDSKVFLSPSSSVYAFHVFPGNVPHIVMLLNITLEEGYCEIDDDGNALKNKYGYITFTKFNTGFAFPNDYVKAFERNNIYKMGVGDKGIKIDAKDITEKPEQGPYDLEVNVSIVPWTAHDVTPEV